MEPQPARLSPRGPLQLEPIVLPAAPPPSASPLPRSRPRAPRRDGPLQPLLQRLAPNSTAESSAPWWAPSAEDGDDEDLIALLRDSERRLPSMLQSDCLPMDHTLPHLLRQVAGTDDLESVQSIKLRVIGRETSLQRLCLYIPRLTELNLDGSSIGSLRELGCGLTGLRVLRVTHCGLETLDGTFGLSALEELYAGYNLVEDIGYLACLPCIQLIDLRGNRVADIRYAGFLTVCAFLRELVLADNPCSGQPRYRATIRELLPGLQLLDGVPLGSYQQDDEESDFSPSERTSESYPLPTDTGEEDEEDSSVASATSGAGRPRSLPVDAHQGREEVERRASGPTVGARPSTATCATPRARRPAGAGVGGPLLSPRISTTYWSGGSQRPASANDIGSADAPSPLTSGKAVCGNLTLALRRTRRRREAWSRESNNSSSSSSLSDRAAEREAHRSPDLPNSIPTYADGDGVLAASRRWRKAYQLFRDTNRQKWKEEIGCREQT